MALLGSSVDPRLFLQDYSGFTRAAEIQAQGMQNLGASIGGAIESYAEAKEKRKKIDASTKASRAGIESAIKLGEAYGIDVKSSLEPILAKMDDPNTTPMEAAMYGEEAKNRITNVLNMGIAASERESAQQRAMMEQQYKAAQLGLQAEKVDIARQQAAKGPAPKFELRRPTITSPTGEVFEGPELPYDESRGMYFDPKVKKYIADPNLIGTGQEYAPDSAMPSSTSQIGGSTSDLIANAQDINILPVGSKIPTTSVPYDGRPAPNRYNNPGGAYPRKDLIQFGMEGKGIIGGGHPIAKYPDLVSGAAANMEHFRLLNPVGKTVGQMRKKWVYGMGAKGSLPISGLDENQVITQNDLNDPTFMSKWMSGTAKAEGFKGRLQPEQLISAFNLYQAGGYNKNAQSSAANINSSLAMSGDMSQQAMGTPEEQAKAARQIEQGQQLNLGVAQNIPQGAIPTESSMTAQQPQLPQQAAPQWTPPPGFRPARPKGEAVMMTSEQVKNLEGQGFRVSAIPNPDGTFMVSGVTTGGSSSGFEVTTPEGTTVRYGGSGGLTQPKVGPGQQLIPDPTSPTGTRVVDVPGGEAEKAAKQEASAAEAEKEKAIQDGAVLIADIDRFIDYTGRMSKLPFASPVRKAFAAIGMEEQAEAENMLKSVKSILKFKTIAELRKASPTGSTGLGQVTQNEFDATADAWGALSIVGNPDIQRERATAVKTRMLDLIHGNQKHRDALLKSGAISQQQYNEIQSQYPGAKQVSQEDANIQRWRNTFTPKPTQ